MKLKKILSSIAYVFVFLVYVVFFYHYIPNANSHPFAVDMLSYEEWIFQILLFSSFAAISYFTIFKFSFPQLNLSKLKKAFRKEKAEKDVHIELPPKDVSDSILDAVKPKILEKTDSSSK